MTREADLEVMQLAVAYLTAYFNQEIALAESIVTEVFELDDVDGPWDGLLDFIQALAGLPLAFLDTYAEATGQDPVEARASFLEALGHEASGALG